MNPFETEQAKLDFIRLKAKADAMNEQFAQLGVGLVANVSHGEVLPYLTLAGQKQQQQGQLVQDTYPRSLVVDNGVKTYSPHYGPIVPCYVLTVTKVEGDN